MDQLSHLTARENSAGRLVTWRKLGKHSACDECLALAYESPGHGTDASNIAAARTIRSVAGADLYLCWTHAEAWKARDRGE